MHPVGHRAEGQPAEEMAGQREQRIARRMLDAEEITGENEEPVILERDGMRRRQRVQREHQERDQPRVQRLASRHQRRPQVKEAVVKKFHSAATSAPASPAIQYTTALRKNHSAIATLMKAPMLQAI